MVERMEKQRFLDLITQAHQRWLSEIERIPRTELTRAGYCGIWSVKDVVAHIGWHEQEMTDMVKTMSLEGSPLWLKPLDERNQTIYREFKDTTLAVVLAIEEMAYAEMLQQLEGLSEDALNDPAAFPGMPPEWMPWQVIAGNTYEHYTDHMQSK